MGKIIIALVLLLIIQACCVIPITIPVPIVEKRIVIIEVESDM